MRNIALAISLVLLALLACGVSLLVGPDGVPIMAQYVMERQPDGSWRIDGCLLERSAEQTT